MLLLVTNEQAAAYRTHSSASRAHCSRKTQVSRSSLQEEQKLYNNAGGEMSWEKKMPSGMKEVKEEFRPALASKAICLI